MYCDQILEGSNKQDGFAVASMLEAFLHQLKYELPSIEEVILQSDNAGYYQCKKLLLLLPLNNRGFPRLVDNDDMDKKVYRVLVISSEISCW